MPLEQALQAFYRDFLEPLKRDQETALMMKLHFRELFEPTGAWQQVVEQELRPRFSELTRLLQRELGLARIDRDVHRAALAMVGMAVHLFTCQDEVRHLAPGVLGASRGIDVLAQRLAGYACAIIEGERLRRLGETDPTVMQTAAPPGRQTAAPPVRQTAAPTGRQRAAPTNRTSPPSRGGRRWSRGRWGGTSFTIAPRGQTRMPGATGGTHHRQGADPSTHDLRLVGNTRKRRGLNGRRRTRGLLRRLPLLGLLSACAGLRPVGPQPTPAPAPTATQWQAQRPHEGSTGDLARWWQQFNDPVLAALIEAAQRESASLAQAATRIAEAQAAVVRAGATALPSLDASASRVRGPITFGGPPILRTQDQMQLQSSWEIDLWRPVARRQASAARLDARAAEWHDARVSLAAELASQYVTLRACERQVVIDEADLASRRESERITALAASAGFQSGGQVALARAASADQASRLQAQQAECELAIKARVALTALDEPELRRQLAARTAALPQPRQFRVETLPAQLISQRRISRRPPSANWPPPAPTSAWRSPTAIRGCR
jgi:hypothetical protein